MTAEPHPQPRIYVVEVCANDDCLHHGEYEEKGWDDSGLHPRYPYCYLACKKLDSSVQEIPAWCPLPIYTPASDFRGREKVHTEFCYPDCALFEKRGCPYPGHGVNITHCEAFQEKWYYCDRKKITLSRFKTQANDILERIKRIKNCEKLDNGLFDLAGIQFDAERILELATGVELRSKQGEQKDTGRM